MEFEHSGMNCGREIHEILAEIRQSGETGPTLRKWRKWIEWYWEHHCRHCGGCDNIDALPPEQDGLCIYCWKDEYERQHQSGVTPAA
jgi:hypothetical protein